MREAVREALLAVAWDVSGVGKTPRWLIRVEGVIARWLGARAALARTLLAALLQWLDDAPAARNPEPELRHGGTLVLPPVYYAALVSVTRLSGLAARQLAREPLALEEVVTVLAAAMRGEAGGRRDAHESFLAALWRVACSLDHGSISDVLRAHGAWPRTIRQQEAVAGLAFLAAPRRADIRILAAEPQTRSLLVSSLPAFEEATFRFMPAVAVSVGSTCPVPSVAELLALMAQDHASALALISFYAAEYALPEQMFEFIQGTAGLREQHPAALAPYIQLLVHNLLPRVRRKLSLFACLCILLTYGFFVLGLQLPPAAQFSLLFEVFDPRPTGASSSRLHLLQDPGDLRRFLNRISSADNPENVALKLLPYIMLSPEKVRCFN
jgi:hypothetical protein